PAVHRRACAAPNAAHTAWYSFVPMSSPRMLAAPTSLAFLVSIVLTSAAGAQAPAPPAAPAPVPAPAPPSTQVAGRVLTLEECIAIALEAQPRIQATLADYAAARYRVNQAFAPLLPQFPGLVSATKVNIPTATSTVARAEADVANARVDLIRARNALRTAIVALNIAMAIDVDSPTQIVDNLIYQPVTLDRQLLRADSLRQRPEYRQAKLRAAAAEALERQTFRNFFPDVTGSGAYGGAQPQFNESWSATLSLNWSLF